LGGPAALCVAAGKPVRCRPRLVNLHKHRGSGSRTGPASARERLTRVL